MRDTLHHSRYLAVIALAALNWGCSVCDAHGVLRTEDNAQQLSCSAIMHRAGNPEAVVEAVGARTGWEFRYRRKRGMPDVPLQITFTCGGYQGVTTKAFEWHPKVLDEYDCEPVELGTITLPKWPSPPPPTPAR